MVFWVPYYCSAAVCCLSLPLLLLFCFCVYIFDRLRVLVCSVIVEGRYSVTRAGCRPSAPTFAVLHWRPGLLRFQPTPAALRSCVERWDDGGEICAVLLCCAVLCFCCRSCFLCMLSPRSPKTMFYCQKVRQNLANKNKICTWAKSAQVLILRKAIYHAGRSIRLK